MKQYTSSAQWPENADKTRAVAAALMLLAEHALDHGVTQPEWSLLAEKLETGDSDQVFLVLAAWASLLRDHVGR